RFAHTSTQLWARLISPPMNHFAHWIPSDVSSTREYGFVNSIPRSSTTASQNHSMSSCDRFTSSSYEVIPCARMKRVTLARSTYAADGVHTIVTVGAPLPTGCWVPL